MQSATLQLALFSKYMAPPKFAVAFVNVVFCIVTLSDLIWNILAFPVAFIVWPFPMIVTLRSIIIPSLRL